MLLASSACGKSASGGTVTEASDVTSAETSAETTTGERQPDVPATDMDGKTFTFVVRGESFNEWESQDIYAEEEDGEPINDAVYRRNAYLEDKYNMVIAQYGASDPAGSAKKSINAGSEDYDVVMANTQEMASLASQGFLFDLKTVPYLNLDEDWWDQRSVKQLSLDNKLFFCTSDLSIMANDATWILMFNKEIAENYNIENIYDTVKTGYWTFDKMYELMSTVATDVNGDGIMSPLDDVLGFATHASSIEGLFFASGSHTVGKDESDMPYLDMNGERIVGVVEKANKLMADASVTFNLSANKFGLSDALKHLQPVFQDGHSLFYGEVMQCIIRLRAMEIDFGVIPFPKYDETQEEYNHYIHVTAAMIGVPLTNSDLDNTGIMLEAMSAKSMYTLQKAYYDTCLDGKFMRDEESKDMLDIILATRNYDIGYIYSWGNLFAAFSNCVSKGTTDFASQYAKKEPSAQKAMDKTLEEWLGA